MADKIPVKAIFTGSDVTALGEFESDDTISGTLINEPFTALSGTTPEITKGNHTWTLTGASTPIDGLANGDSCTLMIDDGSAYTIDWASVVDVWMSGGTAPTLATTGYTGVVLWKVGTSVYAMEVPQ